MPSDEVQIFRKYLSALLLELQLVEEQLNDYLVAPPAAHHIWTKVRTIRAKYYFLLGKLAGLGAHL